MKSLTIIGACFIIGILATDLPAEKIKNKSIMNSLLSTLCNAYQLTASSEEEMYNKLMETLDMLQSRTERERNALLSEKLLEFIYDSIKTGEWVESDTLQPCSKNESYGYAECLRTNIINAILSHENKTLSFETDNHSNGVTDRESLIEPVDAVGKSLYEDMNNWFYENYIPDKHVLRNSRNHKRHVGEEESSNTLTPGMDNEKYRSNQSFPDRMIKNGSIQTEGVVESQTSNLKQVEENSTESTTDDISLQTHGSSTLVNTATDQYAGKTNLSRTNLSAVNINEKSETLSMVPQTPSNEERALNGTTINNQLEEFDELTTIDDSKTISSPQKQNNKDEVSDSENNSTASEEEIYNKVMETLDMDVLQSQTETEINALLSERLLEVLYDTMKNDKWVESDTLQPCSKNESYRYAECLRTNIINAVLSHNNFTISPSLETDHHLNVITDGNGLIKPEYVLEKSLNMSMNNWIHENFPDKHALRNSRNHKRHVGEGETSNTLITPGMDNEKYGTHQSFPEKMIRNGSIQTESETSYLKEVSTESTAEDISLQTSSNEEGASKTRSSPQKQYNENEVSDSEYNSVAQDIPVVDIVKNIASTTSNSSDVRSFASSDLPDIQTTEQTIVSDTNSFRNGSRSETNSNETTDAPSSITVVNKQAIDTLRFKIAREANISVSPTEDMKEQTTINPLESITFEITKEENISVSSTEDIKEQSTMSPSVQFIKTETISKDTKSIINAFPPTEDIKEKSTIKPVQFIKTETISEDTKSIINAFPPTEDIKEKSTIKPGQFIKTETISKETKGVFEKRENVAKIIDNVGCTGSCPEQSSSDEQKKAPDDTNSFGYGKVILIILGVAAVAVAIFYYVIQKNETPRVRWQSSMSVNQPSENRC